MYHIDNLLYNVYLRNSLDCHCYISVMAHAMYTNHEWCMGQNTFKGATSVTLYYNYLSFSPKMTFSYK